MIRAMRWGDNDRYWGPFTYAVDPKYIHWAIILKSDSEVHQDRPARSSLRISFGKRTLIVVLPPIVKPWKRKVYPQWDAETVKRLGRDWYWDAHPREYGINYGDGFLQIPYGRTTHDSSTEQRWSCFLPWTQWRHVRISYYGLAGEHVGSIYDKDQASGMSRYDAQRAMEDRVPKMEFDFLDHDGEALVATTYIEEREWRRGTGWFRWLSLIWPKKIRRSLSLSFSGETGPEKGSWKGGTIGTGIEMLPRELHGPAFQRYCSEDHRSKYRDYKITFVGARLPSAVSSNTREGA